MASYERLTSDTEISTELAVDSNRIFLAVFNGEIGFYQRKQQMYALDMRTLI